MVFELASVPNDWDQTKDVKVHRQLAKTFKKPIEAAGHAFMSRVKRHRIGRSLEEDYNLTQALLDAAAGDDDDEEEEPESKKLLALKPGNWKNQDHYAVLGLSRKRYAATDDDIKKAYRRKVLKHHPDKTAHVGGNDNFFKCIQQAWEILTDSKRRRIFDSCDPTFDETIPSSKLDVKDFFTAYEPVFAREARFSKNGVAPALGDKDSKREDVEAFYQFWFSFESWRTFEMRDEEDTDKADSREEKRWLDRKNVAQRKKYKKEDSLRLNKLVEQAFGLDPRIKKFKEEDRYAKGAKKREREAAEKAAAEEAARIVEEEKQRQAEAERMAKEQRENDKKGREAVKNALKKERKNIRRMLRDNNNFLGANATPDDTIAQIEKVETILANNEIDYLESVRIKFEKALTIGVEQVSVVLDQVLADLAKK